MSYVFDDNGNDSIYLRADMAFIHSAIEFEQRMNEKNVQNWFIWL